MMPAFSLTSPWPMIHWDFLQGNHVTPERLADAIRAEGVPVAVRNFVANSVLRKHRRPKNHRPKNDDTKRNTRKAELINLWNDVALARAGYQLARDPAPKDHALCDVAGGRNSIGKKIMMPETLNTLLHGELPALLTKEEKSRYLHTEATAIAWIQQEKQEEQEEQEEQEK